MNLSPPPGVVLPACFPGVQREESLPLFTLPLRLNDVLAPLMGVFLGVEPETLLAGVTLMAWEAERLDPAEDTGGKAGRGRPGVTPEGGPVD